MTACSDPRSAGSLRQAVAFSRVSAGLFEGFSKPTSLARYRIITQIARGGMGVVYEAWDPELERRVALKVLRANKAWRGESIAAEARVLARLSHPNIVSVFDVGRGETPDGAPAVFVVMELIRGNTLRTWLADNPRPTQILEAFVRAGDGLHAAHAEQIIHGDFKPSNVMLGDDGRVCVLDFGLAQPASEETDADIASDSGDSGGSGDERSASRVAGTPRYMAPEQHAGQLIVASDQFAFCTALLVALHGGDPLEAEGLKGLVAAKFAGPPKVPRPQGVPRRAWAAIYRGLAPNPGRRFASMADLLRELRPAPRRRVKLTAGVLVFGTALGGASAALKPQPLSCEEPSDGLIEHAWSDDNRSELYAFATNPTLADSVTARLDTYVERWTAARERACSETDPSIRTARLACLEQRRRQTEGTVGVLLEPEVLDSRADEVVAMLDSPEDCDAVVAGAPRDIIDAEALARARSYKGTGQLAAAVEIVLRQIEDASSDEALARWWYELAELRSGQADPLAAEEAAHEAWLAAERARDEVFVAEAMLKLASVKLSADPTAAQDIVELVTARIGPTPHGRLAWLLPSARAQLASHRGEHEEALRHWALALERHAAAPNALRTDFSDLWLHEGRIEELVLLGRSNEAHRESEALLELAQGRLGVEHPRSVDVAVLTAGSAFACGLCRRTFDLLSGIRTAGEHSEALHRRVYVVSLRARARACLGDSVAAVESLENALAMLGPEVGPIESILQLSLALERAGAGRLALAGQAYERALRSRLDSGRVFAAADNQYAAAVGGALLSYHEDALELRRRISRFEIERASVRGMGTELPILLGALADIEARMGDPGEARELLAEAEGLVANATDTPNANIGLTRLAIAEGYGGLGEYELGRRWATQAIAALDVDVDEHPVVVATAWMVLTDLLLSAGAFDEALAAAKSGLSIAEASSGKNRRTLSLLERAAKAYEAKGDTGSAAATQAHLRERCTALDASGPPCGPLPPGTLSDLQAMIERLTES